MENKNLAAEHNEKLYDNIGSDAFWQMWQPKGTVLDDLPAVAENMIAYLLSEYLLPQFPKKFQAAALNTFDADMQNAVRTALNAGNGLYIHGLRGRGKTDLAAAVARELITRDARAWLAESWVKRESNGWMGNVTPREVDRYVSTAFSAAKRRSVEIVFRNTALLMDEIKACFDADAVVTKAALIARYSIVPVLILDDIGMEKPSAFVRETFDVIVNQRWAEEMLTVFTSNFDLARLEAHYEDEGRISSRIAGMCTVVELVGDDRRVR